ncbi:cytidylate kinase [Candidatus Woesearchaeota archaeon CG10_big_fil_rev_8_21_14_0_10_44_13]|nr:MAG: cytidylate kinase [Candidatus Woesearchaeota archaeon CG10_big_fil_rev_8_21_14_0_10_44_13]
MIITISGRPGSGKSVVGKEVAKRLNLKYYCVGDFQREIAKKRGISLAELGKLEEKDRSIDIEVDNMQKELGRKGDDMLIDSRIGFHFIPRSIRVFLDVDPDVGAMRIFSQKRDDEKFSDLLKTKEEIKKRIDSERRRYKKYYNIDHYDLESYDMIIDTTRLDPEQVADEIVKEIKR